MSGHSQIDAKELHQQFLQARRRAAALYQAAGLSAEQRSELRERLRKIFEAIGLGAQTTNIFDGPEKIDSEQLTASTERLGERLAEFCGYLDELDKLIKRQ